MTRSGRGRPVAGRAGGRAEPPHAGRGDGPRPLYARALRLRHVAPGGLLCFLYFEGMLTFGALLVLAELVPWWGIPVLPATVAAMVKANDLLAGVLARSGAGAAPAGDGLGVHRSAPERVARTGYADRRGSARGTSALDSGGSAADRDGSAAPPPGEAGGWPGLPVGTAATGQPVNAHSHHGYDDPQSSARVGRQRIDPWLDPTEQWFRQSASRRYE